jgi:pyruvate/2-oxoglutarate dehydrogenase complex dihydrolipoamide acyltransferase (E2) component
MKMEEDKSRLSEAEIDAILKEGQVGYLALAKEGVMVDASFAEVPRQRNSREDNALIKEGEVPQSLQDNAKVKAHKDLDARWTKKNAERHYGYKDHVKVDVKDKLILKAVINAAQAVPAINASFAGDHIVKFNHVGLSIAIAVEDGLVTPVIKEAETKSLLAISKAVKDFAVRAKDKKLKPDEFDGGTITVSNLGAWGIESFDAIINPPQAGILSVGAAIEKPVVKNGQIVPGLRMNLGLSCDHRVVDGAVAAQFLSEVRKLIEQPALMLL